MSYWHPRDMHFALAKHLAEPGHKLLTDPVQLPAGATVPPLTYHGGATVKAPKLVALYAGRPWMDRAKNDQFLREIASYGYLSGLSGQGSGNGTFLGSFDIPAPAAGVVTDADCQAMIRAAIGKNGVPAADMSTIYLLILPDGVKSVFTAGGSDASCATYCAYHSNAPDPFIYAVQPANTCAGCNQGNPQDGLQMTEAHEVAEACSDPTGQGWFNDQTGAENADEVAWIQETFGPWIVQGYAAQDATGAWANVVGKYTPPVPEPQHFKPSGKAAAAWQELMAGGTVATATLNLLLATDPHGPAAPAWWYLLQGGDVQALLDTWGPYFHDEGAA